MSNPRKSFEKQSDTEGNATDQFSEVEEKQNEKIIEQQKKPKINSKYIFLKSFISRGIWAFIMLSGFVLIIMAGHIYCLGLVFLITLLSFKQLSGIKRNYQKQNKLPTLNYLNWFIYFTIVFLTLGKFFIQKFPNYFLSYSILSVTLFNKYIAIKHSFISFMLIITGFVWFVLTLKKGYYRYQFRLFAWINLSCLIMIFPVGGMYYNIYSGICWFITPSLLVICNDIFAYMVGYFFGKTKLIELSPKKTWEGYLGGAFFTFLFSFILTKVIEGYPFLICGQNQLVLTPFQFKQCPLTPLFIPNQHQFIGMTFYFSDFQLHTLVIALFTSVIGPFGGFFASGVKRSIQIKVMSINQDFGDMIPGHGGIIDRFDCHIILGAFSYFYLINYVQTKDLNFIINSLSLDQKVNLFNQLKEQLLQNQIII